jgi:hypothetical protein
VSYVVFCQSEDAEVDVARLRSHASQFFGASFEVVGKPAVRGMGKDQVTELRLALRTQGGADIGFTLVSRPVENADMIAAREAEARGNVPGMGALAERCARVWELREPTDAPVATVYLLCALLASVALGPVLPPDHSTLMGVRSARERATEAERTYRG